MKKISRNVVFLGIVSGLTDISSEMLYPVLPLFLTRVLAAPMTSVGLIEGVAEATASLFKAASGIWSDRWQRRKPFVVCGYSLSAISKPLLALAGAWPFVLVCRFIDRTGKGIRTSPRDALLAASTEPENWGTAFGFHRAMDTAGAFIGPLLSILLLSLCGLSYRSLFLLATIPAALGVWVLAAQVEDRVVEFSETKPFSLPSFSPELKRFFCIYGLFALGNSSDVFLLLKAAQGGLSPTQVILAYVLYNGVYALTATPAGALADKIGRDKTLAMGLAVFAATYFGFAQIGHGPWFWALFAVYGLYGAAAESSLKAAIAERSAPENRGAIMGLFQGGCGLLALIASVAAGWLWSHVSPQAPFLLGAACAGISALGLLAFP